MRKPILRKKISRTINNAIIELNKIEANYLTFAETENRAITIHRAKRAIKNIEGAIELLCSKE